MACHILKQTARDSFQQFEFDTFNDAQAFARKSAALNPLKPWRKIRGSGWPLWVVSIPKTAGVNGGSAEYVCHTF